MSKIQADTIIIIPAYNEELSIALVLDELKQSSSYGRIIEILVVDNNSEDQTAAIAKEKGVIVLQEEIQGYGAACLCGIRKAYEMGCQNIIFLDADFSDSPAEFTSLLKELDQGADFVIGSRMLGKAEPGSLLPQAYWGNKLATTLSKILFGGLYFSDLGPFRGIRSDALKQLNMRDQTYGWTMEMQIKAVLLKLTCTEVSMSYKKRVGISKITGTVWGTISASYKILFTIFFFFIKYRILQKKIEND